MKLQDDLCFLAQCFCLWQSKSSIDPFKTWFISDFRYNQDNIRVSEQWHEQTDNRPEFLNNTPPLFRASVAKAYMASMDVVVSSINVTDRDGAFAIQGSDSYAVRLGANELLPSCTCHSFRQSGVMYKHMSVICHGLWEWKNLPPAFLESPFLILDNRVLGKT